MPAPAAPMIMLINELDSYLKADVEAVDDVITWWCEHHTMYLNLLKMALDYLLIPGT